MTLRSIETKGHSRYHSISPDKGALSGYGLLPISCSCNVEPVRPDLPT